jgi:ABC-type polysaccharide/polyol phosphate export permease
MFFSETTRSAMRVFRAKRYLIENVLIPKIDLFLASLSCAGMAFGVNFVMYIFVSLLFPVEYSGVVLYTIPLLVILTLISLSIGMALGVGALYYRDIEHLWDILLMAGWWITPVIYSREQMGNIPYLTYLNPLAGVFLNLRDTLIYNTAPDLYLMAYDALYALLLWTVSYLLFVRLSRRAAELI